MKKLMMVAVLVLAAMSVHAQQVLTHSNKLGIIGGAEGKNYAMIVSAEQSKKDLVDKATKFLAGYGLVDLNNVNLDEIDENTAEFTVPFELRQPIQSAKMMGMPTTVNPIKVIADLRFIFRDGGAMIAIENLSTIILWVNGKADKDKDKAYSDYLADNSTELMAHSFITKMLVVANGMSLSNFQNQLNDYFSKIDERFAIYDALVKEGNGAWVTNQEYREIENSDKGSFKADSKYRNGYIASLDKWLQEKRMFLLSENRWEKHVRPCFDNLFKAISAGLNGKITGIAEDGNQTWTIVEDLLVPTDQKLQKKYLKKKKSYYDQD